MIPSILFLTLFEFRDDFVFSSAKLEPNRQIERQVFALKRKIKLTCECGHIASTECAVLTNKISRIIL
ncbi:hypothetical protein CW749_05920 [Vibrio sp. vnigr-6D03]|nr:hypothetical protein CW749_05920 [Vibrio sp. vnigr-6D03]